MPQDHPEPPSTSSVENLLADGATVNGSVLQAGSVHGDVHLHPAARPVRPARPTGPGRWTSSSSTSSPASGW